MHTCQIPTFETLTIRTVCSFGAMAAVAVLLATPAMADDRILRPGQHPSYSLEVQPHITYSLDNIYGLSGFGAGASFSIPLIRNGFVTSIDDNVAINLGVDFLHYDACYYEGNCSADYVLLPATLQWNFFITPQWSVSADGGAFVYKGFIDRCDSALSTPCFPPSEFGLRPAFAVGVRYYFNDHIALAMRIGYPTITFGVSFM